MVARRERRFKRYLWVVMACPYYVKLLDGPIEGEAQRPESQSNQRRTKGKGPIQRPRAKRAAIASLAQCHKRYEREKGLLEQGPGKRAAAA
jgi:hypothetical protein